jgi:hypothetical protein
MPESEDESSHHGQDSSLVSQPSRASFEEQLDRFVVLVQGFTREYQRCEQGCVETLRLATHIVASLCEIGVVVCLYNDSRAENSLIVCMIDKPQKSPSRSKKRELFVSYQISRFETDVLGCSMSDMTCASAINTKDRRACISGSGCAKAWYQAASEYGM